MAEGEVRQYWVRNDRGTTWGPLTGPTIELLIDSGSIQGKLQVSSDGLQFAFPWRFPEVRDAFPRELWGDGAPASQVQSAPATIVPPPPGPGPAPMAGPGAAPMAGPGAPLVAGPGAMPMAGPGAMPMAGPGAAPMAGPGAAPMAGPGAMRGPGPGAARPAVDAAGRPVAAARPAGPPVAAARPPGAPAGAPATARPAAPQTPQPAADDGTNTVPPQGQLQQCSPMQLYGRIAAGEQTGLLTLGLSDRTLSIHFRKGSPEFVDSSHAEDALGVSLLGARLLTAEQLQQAEGAKDRFGGDLLAALFGLGLLQPATAFTHLAQRALGILGKALRAESGTFSFEARDLPAQKAMPLGNRWALLSDQVRRMPTADLKRRLGYVLPMPIMKSGGRVPSSDLRLTPHEVRALSFIDGVRSLGQLLQDVPQDAEHLLRVAFLLKELNGVSFAAASRTQAAAAPPPASGPTAAPGARPPGAAPTAGPGARPAPPVVAAPAASGSAPGSDELPALRQLAATMKGQNHFQRLGLTEQTDGSAVKIAYFRLAKLYHPDTLPPGAPAELEKLKAEVFAYIGDAYRALSDDKNRAAYLEDLKNGGADGGVDVQAILQAEELFQKSCILVKARKYPEAVKMLSDAIALNAEEPEFFAWRGYARFLASPDKKAAQPEAFREIQAAIKRNERCAPAHYFLGVIAKLCGDAAGALKHFKRTVELQPDHIDAMREVRMASQKK
ncbi:J domain-containing protein [Corallococcus exercitus]|uniref:DnaJ domain-containing protein n=1 Tax=Corallococcus exercitus TaxID=2316736 RepID=A0A7Y4JY24_9BACT|nr:DnaJ domain-containing protein [Corallococcus exercitus]NOK13276.1 DnaJ domain-containing protein [Corallococcus exercitus]